MIRIWICIMNNIQVDKKIVLRILTYNSYYLIGLQRFMNYNLNFNIQNSN